MNTPSLDYSPDRAEKFRGALVGAAVGDALGARFEGGPSVGESGLAHLGQVLSVLRYTDDTQMTLGMAESLVQRKGFDGAHMSRLFAQHFREEPWRGYGAGPPQVFSLIEQGIPWDQAARVLFGGSGSFGNGAAMRVAPAALLGSHALEQVITLSKQTAVITHSHELGIEGAVLQACAIAQALRQSPPDEVEVDVFLNTLRENASAPGCTSKSSRQQDSFWA